MNEFKASLGVARSLLKMSCSGLIFDSGEVVTSGSIKGVDLDDFAAQLSRQDALSNVRCFSASEINSVLFPLPAPLQLCCFIMVPVAFVGGGGGGLFFVDEDPNQQDRGTLEAHLSSLVSMFCVLPFPHDTRKSYKALSAERDDLLQITDNLSLLVSVIDADLRYEFVNNNYEKRFSLPKEDIVGMHVGELIDPVAYDAIKDELAEVLTGKRVHLEYPVKLGLDGEVRFIESSYAPRFVEGKVTGMFGCVQDVTSSRRTVETLSRLHQVTADSELSLDQKLQRILQVGTEQFALPIGLISSIKGTIYRVEYSHTPNGDVAPGTVFELDGTYCVHTLDSDTPTSFHHTAISEIREHPCYKNFALEAYIGVVVRVNGRRWGTLNFSSPNPRDQAFGEDDYELMKWLSQWVGNEITRHGWETSLKVAERQQRLILSAVHEGIFGVDGAGEITFANPAACRMTGYSSEELLGQTLYKLFYHNNPDGMPYNYQDCPINITLFTGQSNHVRGELLRCKNGTTFVCEYSTIAMRSEHGAVEGAVVTFQDRTEQLAAENDLIEQKKLFESLFVDAPEAIALVSVERQIQMVNPAFCELFGYSVEEVVGKTTQMFYAEEKDFIHKGKLLKSSVHEHDSERTRVSYRNKWGKIFHTETISSDIRKADGSVGGYISHIRDVSQRLEVEQKMLDTNLRLSMAANAAGIGVWDWDLSNDTLHWDEWMYRIFGLRKDESSDPYKVWDEGVEESEKIWLAEAGEKSKALYGKSKEEIENSDFDFDDFDLDFRILRADGQTRHLKSNAVIVYDEDNRASHIVGVNMDVTARKETEAVLRAASEQALTASKAKSDFLATMSHEIRTPLNGVLGMAELLSGSTLTAEQSGYLKILRDSGEGLLELINGILDFSKIEAGHLSIEQVDFNLEKVIYDVARLLMVRAEDKGVDLLVEYDNACPRMLVGDAFRIKQVVSNLVSNAVKFTHVGQVVISVKGVTDERGIVSVILSVSDTGVGIPHHVQPHLFNAFTQADSSTTRKFGGTGLGLAITKQLIGLMSGEVSLMSEVEVGSIFSVHLDLPESYLATQMNELIDISVLAGQKTLVVDDNETNLTILKNQLASCLIEADVELSSSRALERIKQAIHDAKPYDIVVLDYLMPDLDGLMLCHLIREASQSRYQPTVLMTSSSGQLSSDVLVEAGVNVCIAKPMDCSTLKEGLVAAVSSSLLGHLISYSDPGHRAIEERFNPDVVRGRALVVEDMKANMAVARGLLNRLGVEVLEAQNGEEGVIMWEAHQPDIIFMDLHMPVMDGISAMRRIRQAEKLTKKRVPIFALTADVLPERLAEVKRAGGDGLIPKPFDYQELSATLDACLSIDKVPVLAEAKEVPDSVSSLDRQVLGDLQSLLGDDFTGLIEAFFADASRIIDYIKSIEDMSSLDLNEIFTHTHSLKSISQSVGAMDLSNMAAQLELQSRNGNVSDLEEKLHDLVNMYHTVEVELKNMVVGL